MNLLFREELRVALNVFTVNELVSLCGCTDHDSLEDYVYQLNIKRGCKEGSKWIIHILFFDVLVILIHGLPEPAVPLLFYEKPEIGFHCSDHTENQSSRNGGVNRKSEEPAVYIAVLRFSCILNILRSNFV